MAEMLVKSYARQFGQAAAVVRLFSVYGPGLRKQLIWEISATAWVHGANAALTLGGSGEETARLPAHRRCRRDAGRCHCPGRGNSMPVFNGCTGRGIRIAELPGW